MICKDWLSSNFYYENGKIIRKSNNKEPYGQLNKNGYFYYELKGHPYKRSRIVFLLCHGYLPRVIDHINRKRSDDRIENLRSCTQSFNLMNSDFKRGAVKFRGVWWNRINKRYSCVIQKNKKRIWLGSFYNEIEAAKAYNKKALEIYGAGPWLNKIGDRVL